LAAQGKLDEAIRHYARALQLNPNYVAAHVNSGIALAAQGRLEEAIRYYGQALQLNPNSAEAHHNLGNALAAQGKLNEAVPHFQQALSLALAQNNSALAKTIRNRLKSYQSASPR